MKQRHLDVSIIILAATVLPLSATTWNVPGDASSIQGGIDLASAGDTVLVACGTYQENFIIMGSASDSIVLRSETGQADCVTIDGSGDQILICDSLGPGTVIDGFTFTNGWSSSGGAVYLNSANPLIKNCVMVGNMADRGGALYVGSGPAPHIESCQFIDNEASVWGGAIASYSSDNERLHLTGCVISGNYTYAGSGGGLYCQGIPVMEDCRVESNTAASHGGGIYIQIDDDPAALEGVVILDNQAGQDGGGLFIYSYQASAPDTLRALLVAGNSPDGIRQEGYSSAEGLVLESCTIAYNGGEGIYGYNATVMDRCLLSGNGGPAILTYEYAPAPVLSCCDLFGNQGGDYVGMVEGLEGLDGNVSVDPLFCDRSGNDFHLATGSSCLDSPGCGLIGALGEGCAESTPPRIWLVPSDAPTIQAGIDSARVGESVEIACGTYYEHDILMKGGITLRSADGDPSCVVIDAQQHGCVIDADDCKGAVIEGLSITGGDGGGIAALGADYSVLRNCAIYDNRCDSDYVGAAVHGAIDLSGCTIAYNLASPAGSAYYLKQDWDDTYQVEIEKSIIAHSIQGYAFSYYIPLAMPAFQCCDLYGNAGGDWINGIEDQEGVQGNFTEDPLFCDPIGRVLSLAAASPCIDAVGCGQVGAFGQGCDEPVPPTVWQVPMDAPTIQAGIDSAVAGEIVEVACGIYYEHDIIMKSGVTLRSETGLPDCVTIDGEAMSRVINATNCLGSTKFEGLRITGGDPEGLLCYFSPTTTSNCIFEANTAGAYIIDAQARFVDCLFLDNTRAIKSNGGYPDVGAGPVVEYSDFIGNDQAIYFEWTSTNDFDHCLFYENGFGWTDNLSTIHFHNSNIVYVGSIGGASYTRSCSNLYSFSRSESDGDPFLDRANGNVNTDPMFCDPENGDFTVARESPLLGGSCVQIGPYGMGECDWGIISITDMPEDQGRQVRLRWEHAWHDDFTTDIGITQYGIWRRIDPEGRGRLKDSEMARQLPLRDLPPGEWDGVTTVPALGWESYNAVVPTLCDSTISEGDCWSVFFITAHTNEPSYYFYCFPDSGYSLDNLVPSVPGNLRFEEADLLAWDECLDEDFRYFSIYASSVDSLDDSAELLDHTTETSFDVESAEQAFFHVTASDFAGNESAASSIENEATAVGDLPLPTRYALYANVPNPFNPSTTFHFDLPEAAHVELRIYDVAGALVSVLLDQDMPAGRHRLTWQGRDGAGRRLASGVYFFALEAGDFSQTRKMTLLK